MNHESHLIPFQTNLFEKHQTLVEDPCLGGGLTGHPLRFLSILRSYEEYLEEKWEGTFWGTTIASAQSS